MAESDYVTLWRYVDLYKLLHLLQHETLPLIRLDKMSDPYEAIGSRNTTRILQRRIEKGGDNAEIARESLMLFETPERFLVNCWHENGYESDAMWRLYADEGIALRTTETRLLKSIGVSGTPRGEHIDIPCSTDNGQVAKPLCFDTVRYDDLERGSRIEVYGKYHCLPPYLTKRKSFEHEKEYRLVVDWNSPGPHVCYLPVNLSDLIDAVFLHPMTQAWQVDVIATELKRAGIHVAPQQSPLYKRS